MCRDETFILSMCVLYIFDYLFMVGRRRRRNGEMVTKKNCLAFKWNFFLVLSGWLVGLLNVHTYYI